MADRVELAFRDAAARLIPRGCRVLVAASGGGDSIALLHLIQRQASRHDWHVTVAHLDHGLRRGSRADRKFVERLCRALGIDCVCARQEVDRLRRRDESPEEAARRVRREFLSRTARETGCLPIATGHTLDDQAETVLMRLVRGAGATALTGMAESGPGPFVRPLLGIERVALRRWLERKTLVFREDPSNADMSHDRNRVRRLLLPALADQLNPRASRHLVRAALRFREDALYLDELARAELDSLSGRNRRGGISIDAARLGSLAPALAGRVARLALLAAGADARRIAAAHIDGLLDLARGGAGRSLNLPGNLTATRNRSRVIIK